MIEFNNAPPLWENEGVEPTSAEKEEGYNVGDKVPADYLNHHLHQTGECIEELQNKLNNEDTERKQADSTLQTNIQSMGHTIVTQLDAHIQNKNNPHGVTAAQIGLGNVDNTADSEKSVAYSDEAGIGKKVEKSLIIKANGGNTENTNKWTFDGSTAKTIDITAEKVGAAKSDLSNVSDATFKAKVESAGVTLDNVVEATSSNGMNYTVILPEVYDGMEIKINTTTTNTTAEPFITVKDSGGATLSSNIPILRPWRYGWYNQVPNGFFVENICYRLMYCVNVGWILCDYPAVTNSEFIGSLAINHGGTGANTAANARTNLDVYSKSEVDAKFDYGTEDLTAGTSALETGKLYFVYE